MIPTPVWTDEAAALPAGPGAYLLWIVLERPAPLPPRLLRPGGVAVLPPGRYLYVGSARGPGGIRARCRRHLRRDKARRWHVDWLTTARDGAAPVEVWAQARPGGDECALAAAARAAGASVPVPGFGSSDCPACPAHLMAWPGTVPPDLP